MASTKSKKTVPIKRTGSKRSRRSSMKNRKGSNRKGKPGKKIAYPPKIDRQSHFIKNSAREEVENPFITYTQADVKGGALSKVGWPNSDLDIFFNQNQRDLWAKLNTKK